MNGKIRTLLWLNVAVSVMAIVAGVKEHQGIRTEGGTTYRTVSRPHLPLAIAGGGSLWGTAQLFKFVGDDDEAEPTEENERIAAIDTDDDDFDIAPPIVASAPAISVPQFSEDVPPISSPPVAVTEPTPPTIADRYGETIAAMIDMRVPKHLAILAGTRMGKTFFLKALMAAAIEQEPDTEIWVIDPKETQWPPIANRVCRPGNYDDFNAEAVLDFWKSVQAEAKQRQGQPRKHPLVVVGDEWATTFSQVKTADTVNGTSIAIELEQIVMNLVLMSLEGGLHLILITQTTNCKSIGMSDDLRANIEWYSLARADNPIMVADKLLGSRSKIFDDTSRKNALKAKFLRFWKSPQRQHEIPVVVDAQRETVEYVPDFTAVVNAIDNGLPTLS